MRSARAVRVRSRLSGLDAGEVPVELRRSTSDSWRNCVVRALHPTSLVVIDGLPIVTTRLRDTYATRQASPRDRPTGRTYPT